MDNSYRFTQAVLGLDQAAALKKAVERSVISSSIVPPRCIVSWVNVMSRFGGYEGCLPGIENSYVSFSKTESGFNGEIALDDCLYTFQDATFEHVAAAIAKAVGIDTVPIPDNLSGIQISQLGRCIDLMVQSRVVVDRISIVKTEPHAPAAAPMMPQPPSPPEHNVPSGKKKKTPKSSTRVLKVSEKEMAQKCDVCGSPQMSKNELTGCHCFFELCKTAKISPTDSGYAITVGDDWDNDAVLTFYEAIGRV